MQIVMFVGHCLVVDHGMILSCPRSVIFQLIKGFTVPQLSRDLSTWQTIPNKESDDSF